MTSETLISRPAALGTSDHSRESAETPSEWWAVVAVLFCGLLGALPVLLRGIPYHYDLGNHYHFALPFYDAVRAGRIYPGWLAESNFGFGDPSFRFYPPAFYYLLAAMRACLANWYAASLGSFAIISISGAAGAYYWARAFVPKQIAVAAAFLYAFMPYHVAEMYQSAQLAEYMAGAALLFSFAFTKRICDRGRMLHVGGLASSYALLVLTHLPLAVLGSVALLIYALILIPRERAADSIARLVSAIMLAIAATGFYWIRMISELGWLASNNQKSDPLLDYRANFLFSTFSP